MNNNLKKIGLILMVALALSACGSKWNKTVNLTPEEKKAALAEVEAAKQGVITFKGEVGEIPWPYITNQAQAYVKLGDYTSAIKLYKSWLKGDVKTKSMINNLGRLYEEVGEVELAVKQYQRIVDEYFDADYLYDITWAYIRGAQATTGTAQTEFRKKAEKFFNAWQLEKKKTDDQTQQAIKEIRDAEVAAKAK